LITLNADCMRPHIYKFLGIVIANLQADWQTVCTNASWCIGQSLLAYSDKDNEDKPVMDEFVDQILANLVNCLKDPNAPSYIVTNIGITIARLVQAFPDQIIKKWDQFAVEWIESLGMFQEDADKIQAFKTLMMVVMKNPIAVVQSRNGCNVLFEAIAKWKQPPDFLNEQFQKVLIGFKKAAPNWTNIMNRLDQNTRQILKTRYNV